MPILLLALLAALPQAGPLDSDEELARALAAYVDALGEDEFSGAVLVCRDGEPVYSAVRGEASKRFHVPNRLDTRFNLGSASKMLTAIAVCQLAERGELCLDDPVGEWLPDYPNEDVKTRVTLHHLLTHTGGTGTHFQEEFFRSSKLRYRSLQDHVPLIAGNGVTFEPGSRMQYSNAGFLILGLVVEAVSGQSYPAYVREHVTGPAGAAHTDTYDQDVPVENLAEGYVPAAEYASLLGPERPLDPPPGLGAGERWRSNAGFLPVRGGAAGGGYSTVVDLCRLADAFMGNELVSALTRERMTSAHTPFAGWEGVSYGYGLILETQPDGLRSFGHGGDFVGVQTRFTIVPDRAPGDGSAAGYYAIAVMTNVAGQAEGVYQHALRLLPRR